MSDAQEQVFGWLGLNPALLLDTPPDSDNLMVRVVRPGEREEEVLEQARQQLAANSGRRRRRGGRGGGRSGGGRSSSASEGATKANASASEPSTPLLVEITPLEVTTSSFEEPSITITPAPHEAVASSVKATPVAATVTKQVSPELAADGDADAGDQEPRRRRRRSSAAVAD